MFNKNNGLGLNESIARGVIFIHIYNTFLTGIFGRWLFNATQVLQRLVSVWLPRKAYFTETATFWRVWLDPDSENRYSCYFLSETFLLQMKIKVLTGNPEQKSCTSFQLRLKTQCWKATCSFGCSLFPVLPQEAEYWHQSRGCFVLEVKTLE